jgi:hypothetical protein
MAQSAVQASSRSRSMVSGADEEEHHRQDDEKLEGVDIHHSATLRPRT